MYLAIYIDPLLRSEDASQSVDSCQRALNTLKHAYPPDGIVAQPHVSEGCNAGHPLRMI